MSDQTSAAACRIRPFGAAPGCVAAAAAGDAQLRSAAWPERCGRLVVFATFVRATKVVCSNAASCLCLCCALSVWLGPFAPRRPPSARSQRCAAPRTLQPPQQTSSNPTLCLSSHVSRVCACRVRVQQAKASPSQFGRMRRSLQPACTEPRRGNRTGRGKGSAQKGRADANQGTSQRDEEQYSVLPRLPPFFHLAVAPALRALECGRSSPRNSRTRRTPTALH